MQSEYRIEKTRVPVALVMAGGGRVAGDVFLHPSVPHRWGREEVIDLLNSPEHFFPLCGEDGALRLVHKDHVVEVLLQDEAAGADPEIGTREATVELTFESGTAYSALVSYAVASARPRVLDWLNLLSERFIRVRLDSGVRLVNCRRLHALRPLD